jgi:hypothetical protein
MVLSSFRVPATFTVTLGLLAALVRATPLPGTLERRQGLAQVISSCTVPNTVALTFDDGPFIYLRVRIQSLFPLFATNPTTLSLH